MALQVAVVFPYIPLTARNIRVPSSQWQDALTARGNSVSIPILHGSLSDGIEAVKFHSRHTFGLLSITNVTGCLAE
jgi:hypothetical protein